MLINKDIYGNLHNLSRQYNKHDAVQALASAKPILISLSIGLPTGLIIDSNRRFYDVEAVSCIQCDGARVSIILTQPIEG